MNLDQSNIVVRLLESLVVFFLFTALIDILVTDPKSKEIFKVVLIIVCLGIVFFAGVFFK